MTTQDIIDKLNDHDLPFLTMMNSKVVDLNICDKTCTMEFDISTQFCHSVDIVQGGFVTAMLDAAMSHAVFALDENIINVASLEINTSYLEPTRAGKIRVVGTLVKAGYKMVFVEGKLFNDEGELTATASSVGKVIR